MKYLLSTGKDTGKVELYILDLFKIYLKLIPGDIPGNSKIGSKFNLIGITKQNLKSEVSSRLSELVDSIRQQFSNVSIELTDVILFNEETVKFTITVSGKESENFEINI